MTDQTMQAENPLLRNRWLIVIAVMSATLIQVLDTTIVNVALPHMQGSLGATPDQVSWTLTCYLVSAGIFMPLTGYFSDIFGRKKYLLFCIAGFTVASALCGASQSLTEIIIFRLLQGMFGAGLVPLSQAVLADAYPREELGKAMAIWGTGVMVGPILGPTLGGYLTDIASWRWTFYINLPVGIFAFLLAWYVVPDTIKKNRSMDWLGLALISIAIGSLQFFLDRGNQEDWFNSNGIRFALLFAILGFVGFILHNLYTSNRRVFDVRIFLDRNFTIASAILTAMGVGLFGSLVILPMMLEGIMGYPVLTTGLVLAPRGISSMLAMAITGKLIQKNDPRIFIVIGILMSVLGMYFCTEYSLTISKAWIIWPLLLQGFGLGMIFVALSAIAYATLADELRVEAAGLFSLLRTIGSSIGIAVTLTIFTRHTQIAWNHLSGHINPFNPAVSSYIRALHLTPQDPHAHALLGAELAKQAAMLSYIDVFTFVMWSFILMLPIVLFIKYKKPTTPTTNFIAGE
ncbi:MAG: DHA2 family efflux MFS transporter permease subunit [Gammaproteobacteria bacterium]|nr:DHA2 family efflux MFS transporter permease subunit [Gammaproteobacteria bacterium]